MDEKKVKEAIEKLKSLTYARKRTLAALPSSARKESFYNCEVASLETAIESLEKQLPKKPIVHSEYKGEIDFDCPECDRRFVAYKDDMICCPHCACRFDWTK